LLTLQLYHRVPQKRPFTVMVVSVNRSIRSVSAFCVCALLLNEYNDVIPVLILLQVPRLFVDGRYIGSEPEIQRLHGSGELANILNDAQALPSPRGVPELPADYPAPSTTHCARVIPPDMPAEYPFPSRPHRSVPERPAVYPPRDRPSIME